MAVTPEIIEKRQRVASIIQEVRVQKGYTQEELAKGVGVSWSTIQRFEKSKFSLNMDLMYKIIDFLEIDLEINKQQV